MCSLAPLLTPAEGVRRVPPRCRDASPGLELQVREYRGALFASLLFDDQRLHLHAVSCHAVHDRTPAARRALVHVRASQKVRASTAPPKHPPPVPLEGFRFVDGWRDVEHPMDVLSGWSADSRLQALAPGRGEEAVGGASSAPTPSSLPEKWGRPSSG